jgi:pilus assembly protein Flp/PilA
MHEGRARAIRRKNLLLTSSVYARYLEVFLDRIIGMRALRKIFRDSRGVTALEYALIASLIGIVIISGVTLLGRNIKTVFSTVATSI